MCIRSAENLHFHVHVFMREPPPAKSERCVKSLHYSFAADDQKARDWLCQNMEMCASCNTLSRKLCNWFSNATGPMHAIVPDWIPLDQLTSYEYTWVTPPGAPPYAPGDDPMSHLVR